jgi:transcriptional regulator with XRE-family HTH domain
MHEDVSGEQLRALRLAAGLDVAVLARRVSLSNAQLMQLENDQHSLFYTPAIRRHAARKVLNFLGTQPQLEQRSEAAAAGPALLAPTQPVVLPGLEASEASAVPIPLADLPIRDLTEQLLPAAAVRSPGQAPALAGAVPQTLAHRRAGVRSVGPSGIWWMGLFLGVTLLSAWLVLKRPFSGLIPSLLDGRGPEQEAGLSGPAACAGSGRWSAAGGRTDLPCRAQGCPGRRLGGTGAFFGAAGPGSHICSHLSPRGARCAAPGHAWLP